MGFGRMLSLAAAISMANIDAGIFGRRGQGSVVRPGSGVPPLPKKPKYSPKGDILATARNQMPINAEEITILQKLNGLKKKYYVRYLKTKYNFPRSSDYSLAEFSVRFGLDLA